MRQRPRSRFRRLWRYVRLAVLAALVVILILSIASGRWGDIPVTAVFIALLAFLEAVDRGWLGDFGGGGGSEGPRE